MDIAELKHHCNATTILKDFEYATDENKTDGCLRPVYADSVLF